jgi:Domain of unknown function (DUF3342)
MRSSLLAVKGARFDGRNASLAVDNSIATAVGQTTATLDTSPTAASSLSLLSSQAPVTAFQTALASLSAKSAVAASRDSLNQVRNSEVSPSKTGSDKYWKQPSSSTTEDVVVIHVCDENRDVIRDFYCKRTILVRHMKYFEKFLLENENGYDDIDISVHCDVEIFEWLMTYIHEPDTSHNLDKNIVVSILISSEFLQMDALVDLCLEHISQNLNDIIKLPIDLSCICEKLVNKLAAITHPKVTFTNRMPTHLRRWISQYYASPYFF